MKTALIAEDEKSIREFIIINLKIAGYNVIEAENGREAVELFASHPEGYYDAILMDMRM